MTTSRKFRLAIVLLVLGSTVGCDQTSKHVARTELGRLGSVLLPGGFGELRLAENPGSFLSLGSAFPQSLRMIIFTVGAGVGLLFLFGYLVSRAKLGWVPFLGLTLIMAGGLSNLIDRVTRQGLVTDFIFLRVGPFHTGVFNVADMLIMLGIAAFACSLWQPRSAATTKPNTR